MHVYTPRWLDNKKLDFPRGYHIEYWGGMGQPAYGFGMGIQGQNGKFQVNGKTKDAGGYGESLKEDQRFFYGAGVGMAGRGEAVPNINNYCEIDPKVVDKFGIPVLRFHTNHSDYEIKQAKHMKETFKEISCTIWVPLLLGVLMTTRRIIGVSTIQVILFTKLVQLEWVQTAKPLP